ncbi:hypothetical protein [Lysobacter sp. M2-1]|uniref:hypothetical protein n=1 Tax=Lysobacter sp. M2-1 TaxID=2916839 RepID=UPI001F57ED87|nr:hypothetical protein [Lysobacter sp. M2-1]
MKIQDEHLYHGAALIQIAEDHRFTAINGLKVGAKVVNSAYKVNDSIAVYFKYAVNPHGKYKEYVFTFKSDQIQQIRKIATAHESTYIALVCVGAREVCTISADQLADLIAARQKANGGQEDQYTLLVTADPGKSLRAYVNQPGKKATILGKPLVVGRNAFPNSLFG